MWRIIPRGRDARPPQRSPDSAARARHALFPESDLTNHRHASVSSRSAVRACGNIVLLFYSLSLIVVSTMRYTCALRYTKTGMKVVKLNHGLAVVRPPDVVMTSTIKILQRGSHAPVSAKGRARSARGRQVDRARCRISSRRLRRRSGQQNPRPVSRRATIATVSFSSPPADSHRWPRAGKPARRVPY
jgi:hypothetical protein